jgi:hypothetical protein
VVERLPKAPTKLSIDSSKVVNRGNVMSYEISVAKITDYRYNGYANTN